MCWLYTGTFGSFIGYSAGFPLLAKTQFPEVNALHLRLPRPAGRRAVALADRLGLRPVRRRPRHLLGVRRHGARRRWASCTSWANASFTGFFAMFLLLFFATGVGNASTFQMIPAIMRKEMDRLMPQADAPRRGACRRTRRVGRHHRLHLGDRRLRRLLHPQELRHVDRHDRQRRRSRSTASSPSTSPASPSPGRSTPAGAACCSTSSAAVPAPPSRPRPPAEASSRISSRSNPR